MTTFVPSFDALVTSDRATVHEQELHAIRAQAALVRSLLDELDSVVPADRPPAQALARACGAQAIEELTSLACRMFQAASAVAPHLVGEVCLAHWARPALVSPSSEDAADSLPLHMLSTY